MSVFGSLFTAVSGLNAQSDSISMISNNIANVSTVGYKRTDAAFASMVVSAGRDTAYNSGSVRSIQNARISQQGILQQSSSPTDIAMSGNGFFVVAPNLNPGAESLYTRAGSFSEDPNGILQNTSGFYLLGWPVDQNGNLPPSQADISSLVPVNLSALNNSAAVTTTAALTMNLNYDEVNTPYPVPANFSPDFSRAIKVYDSLGAGHDLSINFKKTSSPTAIATGTPLTPLTGNTPVTPGNFTITVNGTAQTIPSGSTVSEMLSNINAPAPAGLGAQVYANLNANGQLVITARNPGDTLAVADGTNTPLAGLNIAPLAITPPPTGLDMLTATNGTPNSEGWWTIEFRDHSGAVIEGGLINFDGNGQVNAARDLNNQIIVPLAGIDWGNGSAMQDIDFNMAGFTSYSGQYNVISTTQNGAELGLRTGVAIDENGYVIAQFSNGQSKQIYKLAIATFANVNGLSEITGNVFRESGSSGSYNLREAGQGSAGQVASGALEASNVDLADEFSKMIVTQRAYSANTKVISTADQMMQELMQLR